MMISDLSVKRPVFASVISLLILAIGVLSFTDLPLREYPETNPPIVSISTSYPGASAQVIETKVLSRLAHPVEMDRHALVLSLALNEISIRLQMTCAIGYPESLIACRKTPSRRE